MAITELKKKLGAQIRTLLRQSKLRQLDLARELKVTPSAVSQMISGRMVPSLAQLDSIAGLLELDRIVAAELRDCLARVRTGETTLRSPLNDFVRDARIKRGVSVSQLSNLTGIAVTDLNALENFAGMSPSPTEAARLAAVLGCEVCELWQGMPTNWGAASAYAGTELHDGAPYGGAAAAKREVPVADWSALGGFDPEFDKPVEFAWRHNVGVEMLAAAKSDDGIAVEGGVPGFPERTRVRLLVEPGTALRVGQLALAGDKNGRVTLGRLTGAETLEAWPANPADGATNDWRWIWPVVRLSMRMEHENPAEA